VYHPDEVAALCEVAKEFNLVRHMDGARFANAVATLACSPASITWQAGVQMLSFGASKNGCLAAEALLFFGETEWQDRAGRLRKRSGHLLSKMRFVSAQLLAYIKDGRWLTLAAHANLQAAKFAGAVHAHAQAQLEFTPEANEVFVRWSAPGFAALAATGIQFLDWPGRPDLARFVFSHCTSEQETEVLCQTLQSLRASS
jgi:threonine aldolase